MGALKRQACLENFHKGFDSKGSGSNKGLHVSNDLRRHDRVDGGPELLPHGLDLVSSHVELENLCEGQILLLMRCEAAEASCPEVVELLHHNEER